MSAIFHLVLYKEIKYTDIRGKGNDYKVTLNLYFIIRRGKTLNAMTDVSNVFLNDRQVDDLHDKSWHASTISNQVSCPKQRYIYLNFRAFYM